MKDWSERYAARAQGMGASEIRELLKLLDQPDIISFAGGIPDPALFPREEIAEAHARILGDPKRAGAALQYSASEGYPPLRDWIAGHMATRGVTCAADHVLITNGSQQALDFIAKLMIDPGDTVLVSRPTYLGALQAFNAYQPVYDLLPGPDNNRSAASYQGGTARLKLGYAMPEFQNPTGLSLDLQQRRQLVEDAAALDLALIEDAAYEQLRYDGEPQPSLLALDAERSGGIDKARTLYCGTFSKTIVPALRLGWIVGPLPVIQKLVLVKQAGDLHSGTLNQMVMHDVVARVLRDQVGRIREAYRDRRDAMLQALSSAMPEGVSWTRPEGGMFIWVTLPAHVDGAELLRRSIAEARVAFVPGSAFHADGSGRNTLRLNFSLASEAVIAEGIGRLGRLLKA